LKLGYWDRHRVQKELTSLLAILCGVSAIIAVKRGVTSETAWLLSKALGTTPEFWANLQTVYDLARSRPVREIRPLLRKAG
jgi:addiction module HigA family antidote